MAPMAHRNDSRHLRWGSGCPTRSELPRGGSAPGASRGRRGGSGAPFLIVYGISGNTHRFWSIANAGEKIGYEPEDDSQVNFADNIAAIARAGARRKGARLQSQ
jgi:hypothetical protein